mmetsp:Transcript_7886/g.12463  ORF Transcript_7886/g.12463 Transcript_7886/m.12463 type:complete len:309 (+) Transcript_7886:1284-2210(+)
MLDGSMFFPVVGDRLVESNVLVLGYLVGLAHPDGLHVVQMLPFVADLLDFLGLLLLLFLFLVDFLNLWLVGVTLFVLIIVFVIGNLLLGGLFGVKLDGESNEFGVLLDQILDSLLLEVFRHILLHVKNNAGSTLDPTVFDLGDVERTSGLGCPHVAVVIVILRHDLDLVGNQVGRVETDTELSNHTNIGSGTEGLHEGLGSGLGNGSKVIDQIGLGHTDSSILNGKRVVGFVGDELDLKLRFDIQDGGVGQRLVTNLIQSIRGVGHQLTKEDLLVGVKCVDNQRQKLVDISREGIAFGFTHFERKGVV